MPIFQEITIEMAQNLKRILCKQKRAEDIRRKAGGYKIQPSFAVIDSLHAILGSGLWIRLLVFL